MNVFEDTIDPDKQENKDSAVSSESIKELFISFQENVARLSEISESLIEEIESSAAYNIDEYLDTFSRVEQLSIDYQVKLNLGDFAEEPRAASLKTLRQINDALVVNRKNLAQSISERGDNEKERFKFEEAIYSFENAVALDPENADFYGSLGTLYGGEHQISKAAECFEKAITINPEYSEAHYSLGSCYLLEGKTPEAIEKFQRTIEIMPEFDLAYCQLAKAFKEMGDTGKASENFIKAREVNPENDAAYINHGILYLNSGEYDKAVTLFQKVLEFAPTANAYYNLACGYSLLKDKDKMLHNLKTSIELEDYRKDDAQRDEDFKEYWNDKEFKKITR